ncbi:MAG: hypothetical protein LBK54_10050 [Propionibacteriaceae bacterium]|jgi:hypothetical protein|nr:hypothetical protein [Propionibacteriaceae bacterium]
MPDDPRATIGRRDGALVTAAGIFSALVGFVGLTFAVNALSVVDSTTFQLFWAALFFSFGLLTGLAMETTRAVAAAPESPPTTTGSIEAETVTGRPRPESGPQAGHRLVVTKIVIPAVLTVVVVGAVSAPLWRRALSPGADQPTWILAGAVLIGAIGYCVHAILTGSLMGARRWRTYAVASLAESSLRLVALVVCLAVRGGLIGYVCATAVAEFAWIGVLALSRPARGAFRLALDVDARRFARRVASAVAGQGASALLVVGFPLLLSLTTPAVVMTTASPLLFSLALTRTPLMVPLTALQGVAVSHFTRRRGHGLGQAGRILGLVGLIGTLGAGLAWLIGPWLLDLIAPGYVLSGLTLAGLTMGATAIAELTLTGVLCQSDTAYRGYLLGWLIAAMAVIVVLLCPLDLAPRTVTALIAGPVLGCLAHLISLLMKSKPHATLGAKPQS